MQQLNFIDFEKIYKIMEKSFPLTEFRPQNEQAELFKNKYYKIYGIKKSEELISFAAVWEFDNFIFIEHLATHHEHRNEGFGAKILCKILALSDKIVCLEVEPPTNDLSKRRVAFYERNGFFFNSYPYIQPSISAGREPIPLYIMTSRGKINEKDFVEIKDTLYKNVYKTSN